MKKRNWIQKGLFILALLLIIVGLNQSGFKDVTNKAVRICYECIGIG